MGAVEKNSFIALPGKGVHSRVLASKTLYPHLGGFGEKFYSKGSRVGLLIRLDVCRACTPFIWSQVIFR